MTPVAGPTTIHLIRHAQSAGNADRSEARPAGERPLGTSLTDRGRLQALALAERMRGVPLVAVIASDLLRAATHGLDIEATPLLREIGAPPTPALSDKESADLRARLRGLSDGERFRLKPHRAIESYAEAAQRIEREICRLAARNAMMRSPSRARPLRELRRNSAWEGFSAGRRWRRWWRGRRPAAAKCRS